MNNSEEKKMLFRMNKKEGIMRWTNLSGWKLLEFCGCMNLEIQKPASASIKIQC